MGMIFCHGCSKEIHETAVSCPHCGAPQSSASSDLGKKNGTARKPVWGKVLIVIFALLAFSIGKSVYQGYKEREAEVMAGKTLPTTPPAQISPTGDLAAMFNLMSSNTDLQRENKFKEIKGKIVEWTLPVYEISKDGNNYRVQTEPGYAVGTFVFITPRDNQDKAIIEGLKTGSRISFKGVISDVTMRHLEIKPAILFQPGSVKPVAIKAQQPAQASPPPTNISALAAKAISLRPMEGDTASDVVATPNVTGYCGTSIVRVLGIESVVDNFFGIDIDAGKIIIRAGPTKELIIGSDSGILSDHNGVACVATESGSRLLVWSNCSGSACGDDFSFFVIDPERLVFLAPEDPRKGQCDEKCASQLLGNQLPQKINGR